MPFLFGENTIARYVTHRECEMTKRSDIIDNSDRYITRNTPTGLIYTENLGWIDPGHANPTGAVRLWQQMVMPRGGPVSEHKNKSVLPLLFPDPLEKTCKLEPHLGRLPAFMSTITPVAKPEYVRELSL